MQADKTTLLDLSLFHPEKELSVYHFLDFTRTVNGREWLGLLLKQPLGSIAAINETQQALQTIMSIASQWPEKITNGTLMVIDRFYDTAINDLPARPNPVNALAYKIFNGPDYSITRYSVNHFIDFFQGLQQLIALLQPSHQPSLLGHITLRISQLLNRPEVQAMVQVNQGNLLPLQNTLAFGHFLRYQFKQQARELQELYAKLDAYYSLAMACRQYQFTFPSFVEQAQPMVQAEQLYHPLLQNAVSYSIALTPARNFLFLTGANMAGKSTFIKAIGLAVYLAHLGMGVPAHNMALTLFHGLLSNIQVADNLLKGESYFFNEVQRIRKTIEQISDGKKWLILVDELFKGTNVQDAMKCSTTVIEGLRKMTNTLFILSTHLYEIGEALKAHSNIQFRYFETQVEGDELHFNYQLKEGISNDRLGYLILRNEGVVALLEKL